MGAGGQQLHTLGGFTFRQWNCFNPLSPHVELTVLQHHYQSAHTKHAALVLLACSLGLFSVHGITELIPCHALAANFCKGFISHSVFFLFPAKWKCHGQRQSRAKQKGDPPKCWPVSLARWRKSPMDDFNLCRTTCHVYVSIQHAFTPLMFILVTVTRVKHRDQPDQIEHHYKSLFKCWKMFILTVALK